MWTRVKSWRVWGLCNAHLVVSNSSSRHESLRMSFIRDNPFILTVIVITSRFDTFIVW